MAAWKATTARMLPGVAWRISSKSDAGSGNCVEAGSVPDGSGRVAVRDSKHREGPVLLFDAENWRSFLGGLRTSKLDG